MWLMPNSPPGLQIRVSLLEEGPRQGHWGKHLGRASGLAGLRLQSMGFMKPGQNFPALTLATPPKLPLRPGRTKCYLLKPTGTLQKNQFQNVKRAAGAHSYHLMP